MFIYLNCRFDKGRHPLAHGSLDPAARAALCHEEQPQCCCDRSRKDEAELDGWCYAAELAVNGEVIMCAGSIHTPQIMQLSGIGPADQLREMGIEVKADVPGVGQNMVVSPSLPCYIALAVFTSQEDVLCMLLMLGIESMTWETNDLSGWLAKGEPEKVPFRGSTWFQSPFGVVPSLQDHGYPIIETNSQASYTRASCGELLPSNNSWLRCQPSSRRQRSSSSLSNPASSAGPPGCPDSLLPEGGGWAHLNH